MIINERSRVDVSIIAANYNNGAYLSDFIKSVQDSTVLPEELIIVDDGSVDNSVEILERFSHINYLKIILLEKNVGFANALNIGISQASGKYIMRIDPDDKIDKRRIQMQYQYLEDNSNVDFLGSNALYFESGSGRLINKSNFPIGHDKIKERYVKGEHGLLHGTIMGRANVFKTFSYDQSTFPAEDYDLFARIIKEGYRFNNLDAVLLEVRVHTTSTSNNIKFNTIKTTFEIRDKIFNKKTFKIKVYLYFGHIFFYRKYLFNNNPIVKYLFLFLSITFYPMKALRRIKL